MDYNEAVKFLFNSIPNYQNKGKTALRPGLKNIKILSKYFQVPGNEKVFFLHKAPHLIAE